MKEPAMKAGSICAVLAAVAFAASSSADVPEITSVTMSQDKRTRLVTVSYTVTNAPAVVTLDIETNCVDGAEVKWASIGGAHIQTFSPDSAVWQRVEEDGTYWIRWHADQDWPDRRVSGSGARAVVTAWATNNTPDYMAVDITVAGGGSVRWYPGADFVPGGVTNSATYRTGALLMRKIVARGVTWNMGSVGEAGRLAAKEVLHTVALSNNYYIGVFPVTQAQWALVETSRQRPSKFTYEGAWAMRPVEYVCYNEIRQNGGNSTGDNAAFNWPHEPNEDSFLGKLKRRTGIYFELPTEAEWEFACRAGNGEGHWGDGSDYMGASTCTNMPGRYTKNGGYVGGTAVPSYTCGKENGTAVCGTHSPNSWGLYDMHGNVWELCLDWYADDITKIGGAANIDQETPANALSTQSAGTARVRRGGSWSNEPQHARSAYRNMSGRGDRGDNVGFRVVCRAGLQ